MTTADIPRGLYARILTATDGEKGRVCVFDSGSEIDHFVVPAVYADDLMEISIGASMHGWTFMGQPEHVEGNQYFVRVERRA